MGIITKEVEIKPSGRHIKYYQEKGYDVKWRQPLIVKIEDLPLRSDVYVETQCDYCGKIKQPIKYSDYNTQTQNGTKKCCCLDCAYLKREETMLERYGYGYAMQDPEKKKQIQQTNLERYGFVSPSGNKEVVKKQKQTLLKNYGVEHTMQSEELKNKAKQTTLERYGVENIFFNKDFKEKIRQTIIERYGVENVLLNDEIRSKRNDTLMNKYGTIYPLQNEECFKKLKETNLERYGVEYVLQSEEVKDKVKQTNLERYGYENIMQSPEYLEKWFAKNGSNFARISTQQRYLCSLYGGILNYPFKCFALDIFLEEENIDIEFDGSGHRMSISLGSITEEDFEKKELYRNVALKKAGIKVIRIISSKDYLPSDEILLQLLSHSKEYFSKTSHTWICWDIDNSKMINAENKDSDGVFFDYGKLRKIKKSDLPEDTTTLDETA